MNDRCGSCHEGVGPADRFCKACGSPTGALFASDPPDLFGRPPVEDEVVKAPRGRRLLGMLGLLLGLAALAALLILPGSDDSEDEQADPAEPTETAEPSAPPTPEPTEGPTATATSTPEPRPAVNPTVNPTATAARDEAFGTDEETDADLPAVEELGLGQHALVLVGPTSVVAVDLSTGERATLHEWQASSESSSVAAEGVLRSEGEDVFLYPFDGSGRQLMATNASVLPISGGVGLAFGPVEDEGFVLYYRDESATQQVSIDFVDNFAVLNGRPVTSVAGTVFAAVANEDGGWSDVATGSVIGTIGPGLLVVRCGGSLECFVEVLNADLETVRSVEWDLAVASRNPGFGMLSPDLAMLVTDSFGSFGLSLYDLTEPEVPDPIRVSENFPGAYAWAPDSSWVLIVEDDQILSPELSAYVVATGETVVLPVDTSGLEAAAVIPLSQVPALAGE